MRHCWSQVLVADATAHADLYLDIVRFPRGNIAAFCLLIGEPTGFHPAANYIYAWVHDPVARALSLGIVGDGRLLFMPGRRDFTPRDGVGLVVGQIVHEASHAV